MKVHSLKLTLFACLLFAGCYHLPEEDKVTGRIITSSFAKIRTEFPDVRLVGTGGGVSDQGISLIIVKIVTFGKMDRKVARMALMRMAELLLHEINTGKDHQMYLAKTPFTIGDISISLLIRTSDNRDVLHPDLFAASVDKGMVLFSTQDAGPSGVRSCEKETYEEALQKVKESLYGVKKR